MITTVTGHVLRSPRLSRPARSDRGRPDVRTQFPIRCSDDPTRVVSVCCRDRVADYAVRFLQPGDRVRATGTLKESAWRAANGDLASQFRMFADDLTALREDDA